MASGDRKPCVNCSHLLADHRQSSKLMEDGKRHHTGKECYECNCKEYVKPTRFI